MNTAPLLVTVEEAAAQLSISTRTVRRLIDSGELPVRRIRGAVRIPYSALQSFVNVPCPTEEKTPKSGGLVTRHRTVIELGKVLEQRHARKLKHSKPSGG